MVNLRVIETFMAVIDTGSIAAAARRRAYSAAAVSRQMTWLQRRIGVTFFEPEGRSIRATQEAHEFAIEARSLLAEVNRFEHYAATFSACRRSKDSIKT
jgi:DNA-binding transcriptional LysR family regulator